MSVFGKIKSYGKDLFFSMGSTLVVSVVTQFALYPFLAAALSPTQYGILLSTMGIVDIIVATTGRELCNTRLVCDGVCETIDEPPFYLKLLAISGAAGVVAVLLCSLFLFGYTTAELVLLSVLFVLSSSKAYLLVRVRLNIDFMSLFVANCVVSAGYLLGLLLFRLSGVWLLVFILGEVLSLVYVLVKTKVRIGRDAQVKSKKKATETYASLSASTFIGSLGSYFDRIFIPFALGEASLSVFFAASFLGKIVFLVSTPLRTVLITYLGNGRVSLSTRTLLGINLAGIVVMAFFAGLCALAGNVVTSILYPTLYHDAEGIIFWANLAIVLGLGFTINATLIMVAAPSWWQTVFSTVRVALYAFCALVGTWLSGLLGYAWGVALANVLMYGASFCVAYLYCGKGSAKRG